MRNFKKKIYSPIHQFFFDRHIKLIKARKRKFHNMNYKQRGNHILKEGIVGWGIYRFDPLLN